ncbi:glycoside hydrolase family 16 protein [Pseudonocardia sp. 73-21]|uniref:glycoside hydrolase family 16 protein n=1 Tax=Pseudonocardia sp. 73-21 TaxID=1895809 RepID=UPI000AE3D750|nr:glycoside hydrolase family 16 protein [Pseudonocardia sp. 73-21]
MRSSPVTRAVAVCALLGAAACSSPAPAPAPVPVPTRASAAPVAPGASDCPTTAAARLGWGAPTRSSDFTGTALPSDWHPYGPEPGHQRSGLRTPAAITVKDGVVTIAGTADGTTGAMSWHPGQRYGRWEACVRADAGDLHPVLLLWPGAEDWPVGGEVDWMEISDPTRQETGFFLHFGEDNGQEAASVTRDATRWTAWALEWTPEKMTAFVNGEEWYSTTETSHFPPRPMNMTMQLDWFGAADTPTAMQMDWARQWALPESEPATLSLAPGDPATGQPELFPDRTPRPVGG